MERYTFPENEQPTVLTTILEECQAGRHDQCSGLGSSEEHPGETVFCICSCHQAPTRT